MEIDEAKRLAGIEAAKFIESGMKVGLGTGSTVKHTVIELGRRVNEENLQIVGVPTSLATEKLALDVGIPLVELSQIEHLDIVIDGADEYDPNFQLIKGGGAALLREKIVAQSSSSMIVVADDRKEVPILGSFPLPIEVTPFAHMATVRAISKILDCNVEIRMDGEMQLITDNGNLIADAHTGPTISNPIETEKMILNIAGVVQVGLFNNMCDAVVLAGANGVTTHFRANGRLSHNRSD